MLDELIKKNPFLKNFLRDKLVISYEDVNQYKLSRTITLKKWNSFNLSIDFLIQLLENDENYTYINKILNGEIENFDCKYILNNRVQNYLKLSKLELVSCFKTLILDENISLSDKQKNRANIIINSASYENFVKKYEDGKTSFVINKKKIEILNSRIINFLNLPDEEYENFFDNYNFNVPKEYFAYAVVEFLSRDNILNNYDFSKGILKKYHDLKYGEKVDIEALNVLNECKKIDVKISDDIKKEVLKNMNEEFNTLEKVIYIYIKLCILLTYDDEFYVNKQEGRVALKHQDKNNLLNINLLNNSVVCYDFLAIFIYFLNELNIDYEVKSSSEDLFSGEHAKIFFKINKFLLEVDALKSIIGSDLYNAKLGKTINGIECKNINKMTNNEFDNSLMKVYSFIKEENKMDFNRLILEYAKISQIKEVNLQEKLDILIKKADELGLIKIDCLSYLLDLEKIIFSDNERYDKIKITIVKNNLENYSMACAVITVSDYDINCNFEDNVYLLYTPGKGLVKLNYCDLIKSFDDGVLQYVDNRHFIPGIKGRLK